MSQFEQGNQAGIGVEHPQQKKYKDVEYVYEARKNLTPKMFGAMVKRLYDAVMLKPDARKFDVLRKIFVPEVTRQESGDIGETENYMDQAREAMGLQPLQPGVEEQIEEITKDETSESG